MPKPNFIVIGAEKSGTTWLYRNLRQHPDVFMPPEHHKELFFFSYRYHRGWDWYLSFFEDAGDTKAIGEATPHYTAGANTGRTACRMALHLPDAKLIYIVRNPVERLPSAYAQALANGEPLPAFSEALRTLSTFLETSRYWARLSDYRRYYNDVQIHCLFLEDVRADPISQLEKCFDFLGLDSHVRSETAHTPANQRSEKMVDRWFFPGRIRASRLYERLRSRAPRALITAFQSLYRKPLTVNITWDEETRTWAANELRSDAERFLEYCGKSADFWSL